MKKALIYTALLSCSLLLSGCGTTGKFVYPAQMSELVRSEGSVAKHKTVAILPFDDYRSDENNTFFALYLIPLMPFGWGNYDRPDAASIFVSIQKYEVTPAEDLAKAAATSLRHSNLFKDAFFTFGGEKNTADFILQGRIKVMKYHGKVFSYGLSVYGPLLWLFGAPAGMSENSMAIELSLLSKDGKVIWEWTIEKEDWITQWIYFRTGRDCKIFATLYQEGMNDAILDLAKNMREKPEIFE